MKGKPARALNPSSQCEAVTFETNWKREGKTDLRCPFIARLIVGRKRLCNKHGAMEATAICLEKKIALIISLPPARIPYQAVQVVKKP